MENKKRVINVQQVKDYIKGKDFIVSGDLADALDAKVKSMIDAAIEKVKAKDVKTVKIEDFN